MSDIKLTWSGDLSLSPTGDLATSTGPVLGTERILRRMMTNPRDYLWNPDYGAGLGQFVGFPVAPDTIQALVRSQMAAEQSVAQTPEPEISVEADAAGTLFVQIRYADAVTAASTAVSFNVPK